MASKASSIRWRFVVTAVIIAAMALPAVFYTQNRVRQASIDNTQFAQEHRDLGWVLNSLKDSLQVAESAIYQYPLLLDESAYRTVLLRMHDESGGLEMLKTITNTLLQNDVPPMAVTLRLPRLPLLQTSVRLLNFCHG